MTIAQLGASETSIERVRRALEAHDCRPKGPARNFTALCPVHGDSNPSLSVTYDATGERTLVNCFTCQARFDEIAGAIGLTAQDLFDAPLPPRDDRARKPKKSAAPRKKLAPVPARLCRTVKPDPPAAAWHETTTYAYTDAQATLVQEVVREEADHNGQHHKRFKQRYVNDATGRMVQRKPTDFTPVFYRAPEVEHALKTGEIIWIVEGEKDADNAAELGVCATTNAQGALSIPAELLDQLNGASIAIAADRDAAGWTRAVELHEELTKRGCTTQVLAPVPTDAKSDLTDHLAAGYSLSQMLPVSIADARALAAEATAAKVLTQIEECRNEANARLERGEPALVQRWAEESERLLQRLADPAAPTDRVGKLGTEALEQHTDVVRSAVQVVQDIFQLANLDAPDTVEKRRLAVLVTAKDSPAETSGVPRINEFLDDPNIGTDYIVRNGETVLIKLERNGDSYRKRYHRVLRGWAEIESVYVEDDGLEQSSSRGTHRVIVNFHRWKRDDQGRPLYDDAGENVVETARVSWDADQIRDGSWVNALPWPAMLEATSRRGKDTAWDAIHNARQAPAYRKPVYTATGWRQTDTGRVYVHGSDAIARGGALGVAVELPGKFGQHYQLPAPSQDALQLRKAWLDGAVPLTELPARIYAPLLGTIWESVWEPAPLVTHLYGGRGSAKTSTARLGMQFLAPELNHRQKTHRAIMSAANRGSSFIGISRALTALRDVPVLVDDLAPDGDPAAAEQKLAELARLLYNGQSRLVGGQKGGIRQDDEIRSTVITTGELTTTGSANTRIMSIPIDLGTYANTGELFARLETQHCRDSRGLLGASLIEWIAENYERISEQQRELADDPNQDARLQGWISRIKELPFDDGLRGRLVEGSAAAHHGIGLMLQMLVERGALTMDEAGAVNEWAVEGILQAVALQPAELGDAGHQLLRLLREGLASGGCYIANPDGTAPDDYLSLGWTRRQTSPMGPESIVPTSSNRVGVIRGDRLYLFPTVALTVAKSVARGAQETFAETAVSVSSALRGHGWITADNAGKSATVRRINGAVARVWDLPLEVLLGEDPDELPDDHRPTPDAPEPSAPAIDENFTPPATDTPAQQPALVDVEIPAAAPAAAASGTVQQAAVAPITLPQAATQSATPSQEVAAATQPEPSPAFRAAAAVLGAGNQLYLPGAAPILLEQPIRHLGDLAQLTIDFKLGTLTEEWTLGDGSKRSRREWGQIWLTREAAIELGIPLDELPPVRYQLSNALKELTQDHPLITDAQLDGWIINASSLSATTRVKRDNEHGAIITIAPLLGDDAHFVADNPTPGDLANRVQAFADALRYPYTVSATSTAFNLMDATRRRSRDSDRLFAPTPHIEPHTFPLDRDLHWTRQLTDAELNHTYVHGYDRGGSYLAAAGGLSFGIGAAEHRDVPTFDPKKPLPGYWRITAPEHEEWLAPNPITSNPGATPAGQDLWVTTPRLRYAIECGYTDIEIHEAWVWTEHKRFLEQWVNRIRDARTSLDTDNPNDQAARKVLKELYVRSFGMMDSTTFRVGKKNFAPERFHMIQDQASVNILRLVNKIGTEQGRWPVAIDKDLILYTSDVAEPLEAWPGEANKLGRGLGQYKPELTGNLADVLPHLTGAAFRGKDAMQYLN